MVHYGAKPHKCSQCDFSQLATHEKRTYWRKAIQVWCDQCAHSFGSPSELQSHKISHTEEKTFLCNDCNKTFKYQKSLTKHGLKHIALN